MTPAIVDTSVWIAFFRGLALPQSELLRRMIREDALIYLTPTVIHEILMGATNPGQLSRLTEAILAFPVLLFDQIRAATGAAELYRAARSAGISIRKSADCLIAWHAIASDYPVLHVDRDFDHLATVSELNVVAV